MRETSDSKRVLMYLYKPGQADLHTTHTKGKKDPDYSKYHISDHVKPDTAGNQVEPGLIIVCTDAICRLQHKI